MGEGCFSIGQKIEKKKWVGYQPLIQIGNTEKALLQFCEKGIGGTISIHYEKRKNRKKVYNLVISGFENIEKALNKLIPFLIGRKRKLAFLLREYCIDKRKNYKKSYSKKQLQIVKQVRKLNKRGNK